MIKETSRHRIEIDEDDDELVISDTYFPLPGYGNNVRTGIYFDRKAKTIEIWERRDGWGGTGVKELARVELEDDEFEKLLEAARKIKKPDDFQDLLEAIKEVEGQVEDRVGKLLDDVICELGDLSIDTEVRKILKDKEKLLDILYEYTSE